MKQTRFSAWTKTCHFNLLVGTCALSALLSACAPLLVGGAMVATSLSVADRRTTGIQIEDERIELRVGQDIQKNLGESAHVNVTSYNRQLLLTGEVASQRDKERAGRVAMGTENVRSVLNELAIMPASSVTERTRDAVLTSKVKAALVDARDLQAHAIKVVSERGTVYLMGIVLEREAKRASDVVRTIDGVKRVVRSFEIVTEQELQRLLPPPPKHPTGNQPSV
jgi:osmotically-inducible protein OsmY